MLMKAKFISLAALAAGALLPLAMQSASHAQTIGIETVVATLAPTAPNNVFEQFYPNMFDLQFKKKFTFQGLIQNLSTQAPTNVDLWFDWFDPRIPGQSQISPIFPITLAPAKLITTAAP